MPKKKGEWQIIFTLGLINIATFGLIFVMVLTLPSAICGYDPPYLCSRWSSLSWKAAPTFDSSAVWYWLDHPSLILFNPSQIALNPIGWSAVRQQSCVSLSAAALPNYWVIACTGGKYSHGSSFWAVRFVCRVCVHASSTHSLICHRHHFGYS